MDAIELLESQHRGVEELFEQYNQLEEGDEEEKRRIFLQIADALSAHASIEEQTFYPASKRDQTVDQLREAVREHFAAKRLIADLLELDAGDPEFDVRMEELQEEVEHHVHEEEGKLFPRVRRLLGEDRLRELGREMQADHEELMHGEPHKQVPSEIDAPAPI